MSDSLISEAWLETFKQYPTLWIAFSGGLDSTVLLHHFAKLLPQYKVRAIHINHGIHKQALSWQLHCQKWCETFDIPLVVEKISLIGRMNIEARARAERYRVFNQAMQNGDCLILAHHQHDQAETVLLQLCRGTGIDGLAAMPALKQWQKGWLARPLLNQNRDKLKSYALAHQLSWVEDDSNQDLGFSRNYLRHSVIPALEAKWPAVIDNIARTAQNCRQGQANLTALAKLDHLCLDAEDNILSLTPIKDLPRERLINVIRVWLKNNHIRLPSLARFQDLIDTVLHARSDANPCVSWDDIEIRRYQDKLYVLKKRKLAAIPKLIWPSFPGSLFIPELNGFLRASPITTGLLIDNPAQISIRFRQGGELFYWHGQVKQLKTLLHAWQIPPWQRSQIPLLYIEDELAAVIGYAINDRFLRNSSHSFKISWISSL